jgi:hypothetical protein
MECRRLLEAWAADVWILAEDDADVIRWAEAFLAWRQAEGGTRA